uniref:Protein GAMETE EXPRESSED 1 n=1 Tax=Kalanchoe fedtschenkoi TaxID=63787 RepID=A0A7N0VJJ6_KALFE
MIGSADSCWSNAYRSLFKGCSEIGTSKELQYRLAWHLTNCYQEDAGMPLPPCDAKTSMMKCRQKLNSVESARFAGYFLEVNKMCHQLQVQLFKQETQRLVNDLQEAARYANDKLESIEERSEYLLQNSKDILESVSSVELRTKHLEETSKNVESHIDVVLKHSELVYEQSKGIAAAQADLQQGQAKMKEKLEEGMEMVHDAYVNLGQGIDKLKEETVEIEKEISTMSGEMSAKMEKLQSKADDIESIAGVSLDKQKMLLDGQSEALKGLQFLTKFQSLALEESRNSLQKLAEFGHKQQEELLQRQQQLQQAHDNLIKNSKHILQAQEVFESKQASMFIALDKLFALHNAMLLESRSIKAFVIYSLSIFIIYMFTSTKQTFAVRPWLYIGLCVTFSVEFSILRFATYSIEQQTWSINMVRSVYAVVSLIQLFYAVYTYKDYDVLNHKLLTMLIDKVNWMEKNRNLSWQTDDDEDDDIIWSKWIDTDITEDLGKSEDPDYSLREEVGENSITTSSNARRYNLRHRH